MKRVVFLWIILPTTTQGLASSVDALQRYHEAEQRAGEALAGELDAAIRKARGLNKTEQAASIQTLKEQVVAGDRIPLEFPELRQKIDGSRWSRSSNHNWVQNGTPFRFTQSEVLVGEGASLKRYRYATLGPRIVRFPNGLIIFSPDFNRSMITSDIARKDFEFRPALRVNRATELNELGDTNPPPAESYADNTDAMQALLTYDFSVKRARKELLDELRSAQREALESRKLDDALSLQKLRERIAGGFAVPQTDSSFRSRLNGSVWEHSFLWERSPVRLSFDLDNGYLKDSRGALPAQGYVVLDYHTIRKGNQTIYFNKDLTRGLIFGDRGEFRSLKRLN